jgi:hypothetical protein
MQLNYYQEYTFNKLSKYNRSIIMWPRQSGKSYLIISIIEDFIKNNSDKDILLIVSNPKCEYYIFSRILKEIGGYISKKSKSINKISFINNNDVTIRTINNYDSVLHKIKPEFIIYDEVFNFNYQKNVMLDYYIKNNSCKCIFTSTYFYLDMLKMLDYYNDFYINIKPSLSDYLDDYQLYNYNDIVKKLYYKPAHLLDVMSIKFIRTQKIKKLNKISNGM